MTGRPLRVLVATDGSDAVLHGVETLTRLVSPVEAEVVILTVLSEALRTPAFGQDPASDAEAVRFADGCAEETVEPVRASLERSGFRPCVRHRFGNAAEGILDEVRDWDADLIILGRRRLSRPARFVLGSVSDAVTRRCAVPVLVAP